MTDGVGEARTDWNSEKLETERHLRAARRASIAMCVLTSEQETAENSRILPASEAYILLEELRSFFHGEGRVD
jgi:hypothetical protein